MRYEEERDLYSHSLRTKPENQESYEDISSSSGKRNPAAHRRKKRKRHTVRNLLLFILAALLLAGGGTYAYTYRVIDRIERTPLDQNDLGITTSDYEGVRNIALLGVDSREDEKVGRSDAVMIVSIDRKAGKIKLTSIARDSYVAIDGHKKDKLTHAYAYGRAQLAVKTLNQNFGLEITDHVTMNFFGLSRVIDYIGGVTVEVDEAERKEMNTNIIPWMVEMGIPCEPVTTAGTQLLTGGQAVSYARIRHTDSDIVRGGRQREVLEAIFAAAKGGNPLRWPKIAEKIVAECDTSLATNDLINLGVWAMFTSPEFEQLSIPNEDLPASGKIIGGAWQYVYDTDAAAKIMRRFILGSAGE